MCVKIVRQIKRYLAKNELEKVSLLLNPSLASHIQNTRRATLCELEKQYNKTILIQPDSSFNMEEFQFEQ